MSVAGSGGALGPRRSGELWRAGAFLLLLAAAALALRVLLPRMFQAAGGGEAQLLTTLRRAEDQGLNVPIPGDSHPLRSEALAFDRVTVMMGDGGADAQASFTLDFTGKLGPVRVSALGLERTPFHSSGDTWRPLRSWTPTLVEAVTRLVARRNALEKADLAVLRAMVPPGQWAADQSDPALRRLLSLKDRRYTVTSWYLRLEQQAVVITEEYRLEGTLPDRPVDDQSGRRLRLERSGQELLFVDGLM